MIRNKEINKKILLFSRDPGGANAIIPLAAAFKKSGDDVSLFGKDTALIKYAKSGLKGLNIMDFVRKINLLEIERLLKERNPGLVITGTSADDLTEKYIWKIAEKLGIPSFAILDNWLNYGVRFSAYGVSELEKYNADKDHCYLPGKILVMDEYAKNEIIREGIPADKIMVTGQPYFEYLFQKKEGFSEKRADKIRNLLGISSNQFIVTFASEPVSRFYAKKNGFSYWGYTEKTIFKEVIDALKVIATKVNKSVALIVKLHPKEDPDNYAGLTRDLGLDKISVIIERDLEPYELILTSDLICGMSSIFLIEAAVLNKQILSIQIGLKRKDPFVLSRRSIVNTILNAKDLKGCLGLAIKGKRSFNCNFSVIKEPVANIINLTKGYL